VTVCLMMVVRHVVRVSWLSQHDDAAMLAPQDQWTVMFMVGTMLLLGLAITVFIVRAYRTTYAVPDLSKERPHS